MTRVRIISLGEIIVQNQSKMLIMLANLINEKNPRAALEQLTAILKKPETQQNLEQFRLGSKSEEDFIIEMISKIKESTGVELTNHQFNTAWNSMNPTFSEFESTLSEVVSAHNAELKMIFISYTNPKDMRHLTTELDSNSIPYTRDPASGEINSICGIPLYLTYIAKKSKAELILQVIHQQNSLENSISRGNFFEQESQRLKTSDIKYIRCIRNIEDPIYKLLTDKSNSDVKNMIESVEVETIFWNKESKQAFSEVINETASYKVSVAKL